MLKSIFEWLTSSVPMNRWMILILLLLAVISLGFIVKPKKESK